jgi:hypothetical protein
MVTINITKQQAQTLSEIFQRHIDQCDSIMHDLIKNGECDLEMYNIMTQQIAVACYIDGLLDAAMANTAK